jgi:prevent-host-death family protein
LNIAPVSKGRVLIVDDEPSILDSYSHSLSNAGFEVTGVSKTAEALRRMETDRFDVIFSDYSMPEVDGLAFLRHMRVQSPNLSTIVMLDTPDNRIAMQVIEAGAVQSLVKPIEPGVLEKMAVYGVRLSRARQRTSAPFRSHRGKRVEATLVTATEAKNKFGRLLERAIQGDVMFITKHDGAKAVLISVEEFNALSRATEVNLETLTGEFDALLARMQTSKARAGVNDAFHASPKELGRAAVTAARKRG